MDECKPLALPRGSTWGDAARCAPPAAAATNLLNIHGTASHLTQYHATTAAFLPNITPLRPPFYPISRHYGRHPTQYHATTAAIPPNITPGLQWSRVN